MTWLLNPFRFGAPVLPGGAGNMWEVVVISWLEKAMLLAEVEMATSPGGANICSGGTPSVAIDPSTFVFYPGGTSAPAAIFDGLGSTGVGCDRGLSFRIQYLFSSSVSITEIRLKNGSIGAGTNREFPTCVVVRGSADGGTTWAALSWHFLAPWTAANQTQTITVGTSEIPNTRANARAWRAEATANIGGGPFLLMGEQIWAATPGGAQQASGGRPLASSMFGFLTLPIEHTVDGNVAAGGTQWLSSNQGQPNHFGYAWPTPRTNLQELRCVCQTTTTNDYPSNLAIQWSANGVDWTTTDTYTGISGWTDGVAKTFAISP